MNKLNLYLSTLAITFLILATAACRPESPEPDGPIAVDTKHVCRCFCVIPKATRLCPETYSDSPNADDPCDDYGYDTDTTSADECSARTGTRCSGFRSGEGSPVEGQLDDCEITSIPD